MKVLSSLTFASFTSTASRSSPADLFEAAYTYSALRCLRNLNICSQFSDLCLPLLSLHIVSHLTSGPLDLLDNNMLDKT